MYCRKFCPAQWEHRCRRIELHGTATERYHAVGERYIFTRQIVDIAHHLRFGVISIKYMLLHELRGALKACNGLVYICGCDGDSGLTYCSSKQLYHARNFLCCC